MNIIKAQNLLKGAPDETLAQYLSNPTGDFPEYLVASEMKRRDDLRKKYSAEQEGQTPKTSIIDDLIREAGAVAPQPPQPPMPAPQMPAPPIPPEAMGIGAVPPPPGMQLTPAPMMAAAQQAPQQFNDGGIVALAEGGPVAFKTGNVVDYYQRYATSPQFLAQQPIPDVGNEESYFTRAQNLLGQSGVEGYEGALAKQREDVEKRKQNYLSDFLIQSGLGMATSKRLGPLAAAAEGAAMGFESYQKAKALDTQAERDLRESEFKFKQAQRAERAGVLSISQNMYNMAQQQRDRAIDNNRQAESLRIQSQYYGDQASSEAKRLGLTEKQLANQAADNLRQLEESKSRMGLMDLRGKLIEKQIEQVGKPKPINTKDYIIARQKVEESSRGRQKYNQLMKAAGNDIAKQAVAEQEFSNWVELQIPKTSGVYLGPADSDE